MARLFLPDPPLATGDLLLRGFTADDAAALGPALRDPDVSHFAYGDKMAWTDDQVLGFVCEKLPGFLAADSAVMLGVFDRGSGALLGSTLLWRVDFELGQAELGFWLVAAARGRGVADRAIARTCRWAFDEYGLERIEARADVDNSHSQITLARVGFVREGTLRGVDPRGDQRADMVQWSLLPHDLAE
jgi:RimJ/RimL family protein N-acetyltransferase